MNLSQNAQATLLLTCYFKKVSTEDAKPLTISEWARFAMWLKEKGTTPADLLASDPKLLLVGWHDSRVDTERVLQLLGRGHSLALAIEKWQRAGLWVVTRSDADYPKRLKHRLKTDSPPVLFGCGNKDLMNSGGIAVIGSRNASDSDLAYTQKIGEKAASDNITIVSGAARGVDETAMLGAMNNGGNVIGIMADSLLKAATSAKWRKGLMDGNAVLVSSFYPEAGFNAGNAMARNKYIYCMADSSLVIHSGQKGGTLNGAEENLKKRWVPLWVKPTSDKEAANASLVAKGGHWCEPDINNLMISNLFQVETTTKPQKKLEQKDLFSTSTQSDLFSMAESEKQQETLNEVPTIFEEKPDKKVLTNPVADLKASESTLVNFYQLFIKELPKIAMSPKSLDDLIETTSLHKSQLNDWLNRAYDEGLVKKLSRPVRYQFLPRK